MIVKMLVCEDRKAPRIVCDVCGKIIDDIRLGAVVFRRDGAPGELLTAMTTHKGKCHDTAEEDLGGKMATGWYELITTLNRIIGLEE